MRMPFIILIYKYNSDSKWTAEDVEEMDANAWAVAVEAELWRDS